MIGLTIFEKIPVGIFYLMEPVCFLLCRLLFSESTSNPAEYRKIQVHVSGQYYERLGDRDDNTQEQDSVVSVEELIVVSPGRYVHRN